MSDTIKVPRFKGVTSAKAIKKDVTHVLVFTEEFLRSKLRLPVAAALSMVTNSGVEEFHGFTATIEVKA